MVKWPEADFDVDAPDAMVFLGGLVTLQVGVKMTHAREPSAIWAVASMYVFLAAFVLMFAAVTTIDIKQWGRPLAGMAFIAIMVGVGVTYVMIHGAPIQTDTLGFVNQAAHSISTGTSPYTIDLAQATKTFPTPLMNGGSVQSFSYPMGAVWAAVPFAPFVPDPGRVAVVIATAAAGAIMIGTAPHDLAPLALVSLLIAKFATWGVNGLTDALYVAPLVGAMYFWPASRRGTSNLSYSGVLFGVAAAMKQQPWFCAPFLFIWLWRDYSRDQALRFAGISGAVFVGINLPAVVLSPVATVQGILTPLIGDGGTMVHLGVGLASLTTSGAFPIAKSAHTVLMALVGITYLVAYWRYDGLRWTAWAAWVPLLLVNYRSLMSYFVPAAVILVYALICQYETGDAQEVDDVATA